MGEMTRDAFVRSVQAGLGLQAERVQRAMRHGWTVLSDTHHGVVLWHVRARRKWVRVLGNGCISSEWR